MNKKKLFAAVISLALVMAAVLPGTLAVSVDQTSSDGTVAVAAEPPAPDAEEIPAPAEGETEADALFAQIMACTTLDEIWTAFDEASDETVSALTDEQNAQIDARIEALEPAPAPAVVIGESDETTVPSEVVYRTVNYTYVAPFGDPVTGEHR